MNDAARKQVESLEEFSRKLASCVDILKRTQQLGDGTHTSAITAVIGLANHPELDNLGNMLADIHTALHADAKARLDAKYEAEYTALKLKAPKKKRKLAAVA